MEHELAMNSSPLRNDIVWYIFRYLANILIPHQNKYELGKCTPLGHTTFSSCRQLVTRHCELNLHVAFATSCDSQPTDCLCISKTHKLCSLAARLSVRQLHAVDLRQDSTVVCAAAEDGDYTEKPFFRWRCKCDDKVVLTRAEADEVIDFHFSRQRSV